MVLKIIIEEAKADHRNLSTCWVDYRKASSVNRFWNHCSVFVERLQVLIKYLTRSTEIHEVWRTKIKSFRQFRSIKISDILIYDTVWRRQQTHILLLDIGSLRDDEDKARSGLFQVLNLNGLVYSTCIPTWLLPPATFSGHSAKQASRTPPLTHEKPLYRPLTLQCLRPYR